MTHRHGGSPGSMNHAWVNLQASRGICAQTGQPFNPSKTTGGGGSDDSGGCYVRKTHKLGIKQPKKKSTEKKFSDRWNLFVNDYEWDLSDVIDIDRPGKGYCCWILMHKNGKKTIISGNVILEEA